MNLLLISNGYPSEELPFGSIYVKNHYERLQQFSGYNVEKHVIIRKNTSLLGSVIKYTWCVLSFYKKMTQDYDVIHVHFLSPLYILAVLYKMRNRNCKIVVTFHGSDINKLSNPFLIKCYRFFFKFNDVAIAVGEELKKRADSLLNIEVDYVMCAGFNDEIFVDKKIEFEYRKIDFLYAGSFLHIKGVDTIINSIKRVDDEQICFVFVGSGEFEKALLKLSEKYNVQVISSLSQKELNKLYNCSKFFILASRNEGFGLALTEAMHCGAPGIVRNIPQLRHQITEEKNGFIFNDENELVGLINKLSKIDSDEWQHLSENSKISARKYSLSNVISSMDSIYQELIKK